MPLLKLPSDIVTRQSKTRVAEEKKEPRKRAKKEELTDEELSLKIFSLFSKYKHRLITKEYELEEFLKRSDRMGLDTETSGLSFYKDKIAGFSLGTDKESAYIPLFHEVGINYEGDIKRIYDMIKDYHIKLDGFNWKFDKHFMTWNVDSRFADIDANADGYLLARVLNNNLDAGLKPLYKHFIDPDVEDYSFSSLFSRPFTTYDPVLVYPYAAVDAQKHTVLARFLEEKLRTEYPAQYRLYRNLELPLTEVVGRMERYGVQMDKAHIYELNEQMETETQTYLQQIREIANDQNFNPGSPKQVKEVFSSLGIADLDKTDEKALLKIEHPLAKAILDYRGVTKLGSTYTTGLLEFAEESGVAHPSFNQLGTDTGRFSSTRFNAQNIPKDNRFRNIFIPREGNKLVSVDYSQQEVRILASLAEDEAMISAFKSGRDFYAVMASIAFNLPYDSCTKKGEHAELRGHMKSIVLGLNYDMGIPSLAKNLGKSQEEAAEIYSKFQKVCPSIDAFKKKCRQFSYSHGYAETVLKRRRYFDGVGYKVLGLPRFESSDPAVLDTLNKIAKDRWAVRRLLEDAKKEGIYVKDREQISFAEDRQCANSVIQGSAADMTKLAMLSFDRDEEARRLQARIVLQIHDEIIIECPAQYAQEAGDRLAFIMNGVGAELMNGLPAGGVPQIMDKWEKE